MFGFCDPHCQFTKLLIKTSKTDPTITNVDTAHLVICDPSAKQGKLFLFLPGKNGIPVNGPKVLFETAINKGFEF